MQQQQQQHDTAAARCETMASNQGHTLSPWYLVDERLHASLCEECGKMVWVSRSGSQESWRIGGEALRQDCPGEASEEGLASS